jgi:hypothetical protein
MSTPVPNPELEWLRALLRDVETAQGAIPLLDKPTSVIGPGPAWTGTKADAVHDNDLKPHVKPFADALHELDDEVRRRLHATPATVSANVAKLMRIDYYGR